MNPAARGANDELVNFALIGLLAAFGLALLLRAAASVAAYTTGSPEPDGGSASGLHILAQPAQPARAFDAPGLSAVAYWGIVVALLGILSGLAWCVWRLIARLRHRSARDPHRIQGTATARDIDVAASKSALVRRGATLRPSTKTHAPVTSATSSGAAVDGRSGHRSRTRSSSSARPVQARDCISSSTQSSMRLAL